MATIVDVAKEAGVSRMTVSRAINNSGYVSAEARERIEEAVKRLDYKPNLLAKALVTRQQRTLAYVMVNISDPFHNLVKQGFESVAYHRGYTSIMCDVHSAERQQDYINSFQENRTGGVAFHHLAITKEQTDRLGAYGISCVLIDNEWNIPGISSVCTDNVGGAKMAVDHLFDRGYRRVGCIHGVLEPYQSEAAIPYEDTFQFRIWRQRTKGFHEAMKAHGLDPACFFVCNGRAEIAEKQSEEIVNAILNMKEMPDALYCENDVIALSILKRLQEHHIQIPDQIALIGHDGLDMVKMLHPEVTTIAQPRYEIGKVAAELLINQIEKKSAPEQIILYPKLQLGETT